MTKKTIDTAPGKRLIVKNSVWLLIEKVILMGGGLLLSIVFARLLGKDDFGRYNYVLSFVALLAPVFALGMYNVLLREFSKHPDKISDILRTCLTSRLMSGAVVMVIAVISLYGVFGMGWKFELIGLLLFSHIFNAFEVFARWFVHKSLNPVLVKWRVANFVLFALIKLWVIWQYTNFSLLIGVMAVEVLVKNSGYHYLYQRYREVSGNGRFQLDLFKDIFSQSKFLILSSLASVIYLKIDILMLESMVSIEEVGVYSVAAQLSQVWYVLPQVAITAFFPKLLAIAKDQPKRYDSILQKGFDILFICALILSLLVFLVSLWIVEILYGQAYAEAAQILRLHIFASCFIYMRALLSQWLVSERFAQFSLISQVSGAVANVLLNLWLIPLYGAWGAAVATVISYAVTSYFCLFFFKRTRKLGFMMTKAMVFPLRLRAVFKRV
ncbi:MAG: flippase [Algicola sp.]|nr:flippase [Algicola sp.]